MKSLQKVVKASRLEDQENVCCEYNQVHEAIEDIAPTSSEGERADQQSHEQEHHGLVVEAEDEVLSEVQGDAGHGRYRQPDGRERGAKRKVDTALKFGYARGPKGGDALREENEQRNQEA